MSVFKAWREDTASSLNNAFSEDIKLWKGYRFIKAEDDVSGQLEITCLRDFDSEPSASKF